ncbi:MAG: hypothetical protein JXR76_22035 [Deltaproteobacteria bacterium]|nr:hypothetical protein [Deltaproteobacteria bacterium]
MSNVFREAKHNQVVALEQLGWLFGRIAEEIGEGNKQSQGNKQSAQTDVVKRVDRDGQ